MDGSLQSEVVRIPIENGGSNVTTPTAPPRPVVLVRYSNRKTSITPSLQRLQVVFAREVSHVIVKCIFRRGSWAVKCFDFQRRHLVDASVECLCAPMGVEEWWQWAQEKSPNGITMSKSFTDR